MQDITKILIHVKGRKTFPGSIIINITACELQPTLLLFNKKGNSLK